MYTRCLIVFALLLTHISIHANTTIDSLYQIVEAESVDSLKRKAYENLLKYLDRQNDQQLGNYAHEMADFAKAKNDTLGMAYANLYLGYYYVKESAYEKSLEFLEQSKAYYTALNSEAVIAVFAEMTLSYDELGDREKQLLIIQEMLDKAKELKTDEGIGKAYHSLSIYQGDLGEKEEALKHIDSAAYYYKLNSSFENYAIACLHKANLVRESDPFQAIELLKESEQICVEHDIIRVLNVLYGGLFNVYNAIGKKKEAMEVALKVLALGERQGNKQTIVQGQQNIGTVHLAMGNYEEAEDYFLQSLEIAESTKYTAGIYRANGSLAIVYEGMKMYEKAVPYYKGSIKLLEDLSYYSELPENYGNLAGCYLEMTQLDSAFACLQKGASYVKDNTPVEMSILNAGYSNYYFQKENYQKAINYGEDAYAHSVEISLLKNTARILYESHKTKGNYAKALQYHEAYKQHQDSVFNQENIQNITRQELTYDFEKEKEVAALQQAQQEALLKAESRQARGIAIGVSILALLASVFLWNTRRQNKIIAQKNGQLEQLNQTKDHIFAVLGHDLRKPALSFRGITEKLHYLIEKQDFKTMNQLGAVLEQNALQLNTLLDNVLNWALTQKSAVTYTPKAIDANESVAETLQLFKGLAAEKNIQLQSSIPNDLKLYVDANSWAVILRNLVDNAIKFTPKGGTVELQARPSPKGVHISVKDNGIGITPENLKDIFVLKEQKSTRGTKGEKGTGLGLHLVQELVKINQGTIDVQSQIQQGTTFNLLLPSI